MLYQQHTLAHSTADMSMVSSPRYGPLDKRQGELHLDNGEP